MPLDPVIHQQNRLQLLAMLTRNGVMSFTELRDACALTTGNAGAHLVRLEAAGYVTSARRYVGSGFELHYRVTDLGIERFRAYLVELRALLGETPEGVA